MRRSICICILILGALSIRSQVVINEVDLDHSYFEIKNISDSIVDVKNYYLVLSNSSMRVGSYLPFCGSFSFMLPPDGLLAFQGSVQVSWMEGEIALFNSNQFSDPSALIHYMQWGTTGHDHEAIAQVAGVWLAGDFIPVILQGGSLEYDGDGNSSTDWIPAASPSICEENGTGCSVGVGTVIPNSNPFIACIGDDHIEGFGYSFHGNLSEHQRVIIVNGQDIILGFSEPETGGVNLESLTPSDTIGLHWIYVGYDGPIGNLTLGGSLDDIVGCYEFADPVPVIAHFIHAGELQVTYRDTVFTDEFSICSTDNVPDRIVAKNTSTDGHSAFVLVNDETDNVYDIFIDSIDTDLNGIPLSLLRIVSFSYGINDTIEGRLNRPWYYVHSVSGCDVYTSNEVVITMDVCTEGINENKILTVEPYPNPALEEMIISGLPLGSSIINIYDALGRKVMIRNVTLNEPSIRISLSALPAGMYVVNIFDGTLYHTGKVLRL